MTTTVYGTFYNATGSLSPAAIITDYISGADTDWREQMETSGALDAITDDFTDAIDAALPDGVSLCGTEFIGPHHSDPDYDYDDDIDIDGFRDIIDSIDLAAIIERHETAATERALEDIDNAVLARTETAEQLAADEQNIADTVRAALRLDVPATTVAERLGVTRARVYQIRDGRR